MEKTEIGKMIYEEYWKGLKIAIWNTAPAKKASISFFILQINRCRN